MSSFGTAFSWDSSALPEELSTEIFHICDTLYAMCDNMTSVEESYSIEEKEAFAAFPKWWLEERGYGCPGDAYDLMEISTFDIQTDGSVMFGDSGDLEIVSGIIHDVLRHHDSDEVVYIGDFSGSEPDEMCVIGKHGVSKFTFAQVEKGGFEVALSAFRAAAGEDALKALVEPRQTKEMRM